MTLEILGAAMFAVERTVMAGFTLLLVSFAAAGIIHFHHDETPWWLAVYSIIGTVLLVLTRREARMGAVS